MVNSTSSLSVGSIGSPAMSSASSSSCSSSFSGSNPMTCGPLSPDIVNLTTTTTATSKRQQTAQNRRSQKNSASSGTSSKQQPTDRRKRLAANARERKRMHLLNNAYDELRRRLADAENKSKYDVLVQAKEYIQALASIIEQSDSSEMGESSAAIAIKQEAPRRQQPSINIEPTAAATTATTNQPQQHYSQLSVSPALTSNNQIGVHGAASASHYATTMCTTFNTPPASASTVAAFECNSSSSPALVSCVPQSAVSPTHSFIDSPSTCNFANTIRATATATAATNSTTTNPSPTIIISDSQMNLTADCRQSASNDLLEVDETKYHQQVAQTIHSDNSSLTGPNNALPFNNESAAAFSLGHPKELNTNLLARLAVDTSCCYNDGARREVKADDDCSNLDDDSLRWQSSSAIPTTTPPEDAVVAAAAAAAAAAASSLQHNAAANVLAFNSQQFYSYQQHFYNHIHQQQTVAQAAAVVSSQQGNNHNQYNHHDLNNHHQQNHISNHQHHHNHQYSYQHNLQRRHHTAYLTLDTRAQTLTR